MPVIDADIFVCGIRVRAAENELSFYRDFVLVFPTADVALRVWSERRRVDHIILR